MTNNAIAPASTPLESQSVFSHISSRRKTTNSLATFLVYATMVIAMIPLVWVLWTVISRGLAPVLTLDWWTASQQGVLYHSPGGGALHAIVGTFTQTLIASVLSIPIGLFTAIYLVEYANGNRLGRITTFMVDILTGVPSIVAALFVFTTWITLFGFERSGMAVALSLVLLMVPVVVRNTEEMLRVVPMDLREASYALGVPKWKTIAKIVLPTALSGIVTGIMLSVARVMGESAPMLILVATSRIITWNPFGQSQSSLPLFMLDMYKAGNTGAAFDKMWGAALTLVLIIALINIVARVISAKFSVKQ